VFLFLVSVSRAGLAGWALGGWLGPMGFRRLHKRRARVVVCLDWLASVTAGSNRSADACWRLGLTGWQMGIWIVERWTWRPRGSVD